MKKRSLLLILVLTISLTIPIFLTQTKPVYTQSIITPTQTYHIPETINVTTTSGLISLQVDFNVTTSIEPLIEGDVSGFSINITATSQTPNPTAAITPWITINSDSQINSGIMLPISTAFGSNVTMYSTWPGFLPTDYYPANTTGFYLFVFENVLLLSGITGFPAQLSFNLSATIGIYVNNQTASESESVYLDSATHGGSAVSVVLPNYAETPPVITIYTYGLLLLVFLLPITLAVTDWRIKVHKLKKESVEGV
ncbi:MAG: hypothetical protein WED07_09740 [Candidatus Freyarchaeum deiterrae]